MSLQAQKQSGEPESEHSTLDQSELDKSDLKKADRNKDVPSKKAADKKSARAENKAAGNSFFSPTSIFKPARLGILLGSVGTVYGTSSIALYQYWYKDFPLTKFHSFNDNGEWMQMDKAGHIMNAYYMNTWSTELFNWTGTSSRKAVIYGAITSTLVQSTIEVYDGFSEKWGFSWGDVLANTAGTGLSVGQNLLWNEQRIVLKFSFHPESYDFELKDRIGDLYGTSFLEQMIKDYNGLTFWASVNPSSFMRETTLFPSWLNVAVGYGADGMLGGFSNEWCSDPSIRPEDCNQADLVSRLDIARQREYYLSLDIDLTRIPTQSAALKTVFGIVNIIKIPAPTLILGQGNKPEFSWFYF